jgi:hypothetical protein
MSNRPVGIALAWVLAFCTIGLSADQRAAAGPDVTARAVAAAEAFLATLDPPRRSKANIDLNDKTRIVWSNLPTGIAMQVGATERNGLKLGDMTPAQEMAALALLAATLSPEGYQKAMAIVDADQVLEVRSAPSRAAGAAIRFGRAEYYIGILGKPSAADKWMLQFGGHHLAINVTVVGPNNVMTPSLPAAQPAKYTLNGQTIRPLGRENDNGFALINALSPAQQKQAVLNYAVTDLVLGPGADGKVIQPEGIVASALDAGQQRLLLDVVHEWIGILNDEAAAAKMAEVKANLPRTYFAWSGTTKNGGLAYYRIQGPTLVIEYAPQQGDLDHIHTIYRDPTNDYGAKLVMP